MQQQQQIRRLALFLGALAAFAGGMFVVACGTDNGDTTKVPTPPQVDSSDGDNKKDTGADDGTDPDDPDPNDPDANDPDPNKPDSGPPDCSKAPKVRDNKNGFYCSFLPTSDAGVDGGRTAPYCRNDETCCNPAEPANSKTHNPTFCADGKGGDAKCKAYAEAHADEGLVWPEIPGRAGSTWECADKVACGGDGWSCCLFTGPQFTEPKDSVNIGNSQDLPKECNAKQAFKTGGTRCVQSDACPAGDKTEIKLCSSGDQNCPAGTTCTPFTAFFRDLGYCR